MKRKYDDVSSDIEDEDVMNDEKMKISHNILQLIQPKKPRNIKERLQIKEIDETFKKDKKSNCSRYGFQKGNGTAKNQKIKEKAKEKEKEKEKNKKKSSKSQKIENINDKENDDNVTFIPWQHQTSTQTQMNTREFDFLENNSEINIGLIGNAPGTGKTSTILSYLSKYPQIYRHYSRIIDETIVIMPSCLSTIISQYLDIKHPQWTLYHRFNMKPETEYLFYVHDYELYGNHYNNQIKITLNPPSLKNNGPDDNIIEIPPPDSYKRREYIYEIMYKDKMDKDTFHFNWSLSNPVSNNNNNINTNADNSNNIVDHNILDDLNLKLDILPNDSPNFTNILISPPIEKEKGSGGRSGNKAGVVKRKRRIEWVHYQDQGVTIIPTNLIVVPAGCFNDWMNEINKFFPTLNVYPLVNARHDKIDVELFKKCDIVLCNPRKYRELAIYSNNKKIKWQRVFFDEIITIDLPQNISVDSFYYWGISGTWEEMDKIKNNGFLRRLFQPLTKNEIQLILIKDIDIDHECSNILPYLKYDILCKCELDHQIMNKYEPAGSTTTVLMDEELFDEAKDNMIMSILSSTYYARKWNEVKKFKLPPKRYLQKGTGTRPWQSLDRYCCYKIGEELRKKHLFELVLLKLSRNQKLSKTTILKQSMLFLNLIFDNNIICLHCHKQAQPATINPNIMMDNEKKEWQIEIEIEQEGKPKSKSSTFKKSKIVKDKVKDKVKEKSIKITPCCQLMYCSTCVLKLFPKSETESTTIKMDNIANDIEEDKTISSSSKNVNSDEDDLHTYTSSYIDNDANDEYNNEFKNFQFEEPMKYFHSNVCPCCARDIYIDDLITLEINDDHLTKYREMCMLNYLSRINDIRSTKNLSIITLRSFKKGLEKLLLKKQGLLQLEYVSENENEDKTVKKKKQKKGTNKSLKKDKQLSIKSIKPIAKKSKKSKQNEKYADDNLNCSLVPASDSNSDLDLDSDSSSSSSKNSTDSINSNNSNDSNDSNNNQIPMSESLITKSLLLSKSSNDKTTTLKRKRQKSMNMTKSDIQVYNLIERKRNEIDKYNKTLEMKEYLNESRDRSRLEFITTEYKFIVPKTLTKREACLFLIKNETVKNKKKTLIFINNMKIAKMLAELLARQSIKYAIVNGDVNRQRNIRTEFENGKIQVLILQGSRMGSGANLQSADLEIIYDKPTAGMLEQATARAQRYGQKNQLEVYSLMSY